ncbi:MAG: hypothetical protein OXU22_07905 [Gammaproteobacteria bacterium]|nr:hypothetical protein [Gammaproteobacteria bacterium]
MRATLPFPDHKPAAYIRLRDEPPFDPGRHLALEAPAHTVSLADLGYDRETIARSPSPLGLTSAFRIFSDEGLAVMRELAQLMKCNRNDSAATGENRLGSYLRGAGYRSRFVRDFCECRQLLDHRSGLAGVSLARHSVPAVACGINYAPEDVTRAIDTWHVDSVSFDAVILLTDPGAFRGGQFQYFQGTQAEGEAILGVSGVRGTQRELPPERVKTMTFPAAGYGFLQQGNLVFHRACRLREKAERTTLLPSFVALGEHRPDRTNVDSLRNWGDPGMLTELARHEAHLARDNLRRLIDDLPLGASPVQVADAIDGSVSDLTRYASRVRAAAGGH